MLDFLLMLNPLSAAADGTKTKVILFIVAGIVLIVLIGLLIDGIRKYIRGLDTAALGGLLLWLGYKNSENAATQSLSELMYIVGATLLVTGLLVFIIIKIIRHKHKQKLIQRTQSEWERDEAAGKHTRKAADKASDKTADTASDAAAEEPAGGIE